jgi:BirA family transcriptional regulator, biotin operon repressor / biotin---[acetyl-CoA-carboxylase] ligase
LSTDPGWPDGVGRIVLDETDSTNAHATRIAGTLTRPTWIIAYRQTAARGRRGRAWAMPAGNFAATLVMPVTGGPGQAALRSFTASLALADALAVVAGPHARIALKWPNDVLLNGGKVAGILLEGIGPDAGHLAVGIGVNLIHAPDAVSVEKDAMRPVSLVGETGLTVAPDAFLTPLAAAFARWEAVFRAEGFAGVRTAWLTRAARLGEALTARLPTREVTGRFDGIGEDGALILATAGGVQRIHAADVYF